MTEKDKVFFHKPNLELFDSMGLMSVDMHYHTRYSDSYTTVRSLLKKAWKKRVGVAITDHNQIKGSLGAVHNTKEVTVIPGIEVSCIEGPHILFYFYNTGELEEFYQKHVKPYKQGNPYMSIRRKAGDVIDAASDYNCIKCAAHPYGYTLVNSGLSKCVQKKYVEEDIFGKIDAMEAICGAMGRKHNRKAIDKLKETGKCFTGGTDGHTLLELGHVVTSSYSHDIDSFLSSIVKKRNYVIGKETPMIPRTNILPSLMSKHMRYAVPSIRIQYAINKTRVARVPMKVMEKGASIRRRLKDLAKH